MRRRDARINFLTLRQALAANPDGRVTFRVEGGPPETVERAGDDPRFGVDPIEIDRAGLSYTVDTLGELTRRLPGAELFFLVGADALATFPRWREPRRVLELARLVVLRRASDDVELPAMMREAPHREPIVLASRRVDVSSTEVRARVRAGLSIRGFVPDAVAAYVAQARLYR